MAVREVRYPCGTELPAVRVAATFHRSYAACSARRRRAAVPSLAMRREVARRPSLKTRATTSSAITALPIPTDQPFCDRPEHSAIVVQSERQSSREGSHGRVAEWQTRWLQVPVSFGTWGSSPLRPQNTGAGLHQQSGKIVDAGAPITCAPRCELPGSVGSRWRAG